jgi:hypothetical protein
MTTINTLLIGDSHVSGFVMDNAIISVNELHVRDSFGAIHLGPRTLFKIINHSSIIDELIILNKSKLLNVNKVVLSFGEIDIRSHYFNPESTNYQLQDLIHSVMFLHELVLKHFDKSIEIVWLSPIAPVHHESELAPKNICNIHGHYKQRLEIIHRFNELLYFSNIKTYNLLPKTINSQGFLEVSKTFDGLHINSETMKLIINQI